MSRLGDAVRLAIGTFTAVPVPAPRRVDRSTAGLAVLLAPVAVLPVGLLVAIVAWGADALVVPSVVGGALAIGVGAWATRGFHLDGLADTADALASSYDAERALAVARTGDVGPAGAATLVLVLLAQTSAAGAIASREGGPLVVGALWCLARAAAGVGLRRGVPAARTDGMGATFAGSVRLPALAAVWIVAAGVGGLAGAVLLDATVLQGVATVLVALAAVVWLVHRVTRRLGGIVGDAVGAGVEVALAVLLVGLSAVLP